MAKAFLPERRIWTQQPQGPVEVDWANPISRDLVVAFNGINEWTRHTAPLTKSSASIYALESSKEGLSYSYEGSRHLYVLKNPLDSSIVRDGVTLVSLVTTKTIGTNQTDSISVGNGTQFLSLQGRFQDATKNFALYCRASAGDKSINSSVTPQPGTTYLIVGVFRSGTGQKELWINGRLDGTNSTDWGSQTPDRFRIGADCRSGAAQWTGLIHQSLLFDRPLTAAEVASISANPWQLFKPVTRRVYFDVGGSSGLTITPPLLTNSNSLYSPSVTPGAVGVSAPLLTNSSTLYAPTVSAGGSIVQAPLLTNTSDLFSPTLNPGAVQVAPPLLPSENAFFAPVVSAGGSVVQAPLLTNTSTTYGPTVGVGAVAIAPPLFTNSSTIYGPSVAASGPQTIDAPLFTNSGTIYAPSVGEVSPLSDAEMRHMYEMVQAIYAAVVTNAPLDVNLVRVRGQSIIGTGAAADPWGPA